MLDATAATCSDIRSHVDSCNGKCEKAQRGISEIVLMDSPRTMLDFCTQLFGESENKDVFQERDHVDVGAETRTAKTIKKRKYVPQVLPFKQSKLKSACPTTKHAAALPTLVQTAQTTAGPDAVSRITVETLMDLLYGRYASHFDSVLLIDCRFDYEFNGGHIQGAQNIDSKPEIESLFHTLRNEHTPASLDRTAVIFHCEFSQSRAPQTGRFWRSLDRAMNPYPTLSFPHVFVLDGGYKAFYETKQAASMCGDYVSMWSPKHTDVCKQRTRDHRREWNPKGKGSRRFRESLYSFKVE